MTKPDIFAFGESGTSTSRGLFLNGYSFIFLKAKFTQKNYKRRGLVIFYLEKYTQLISRAEVSSKFDIVWVRFERKDAPVYFCFNYAPGSHHPEKVHCDFYMELQKGFDKFKGTGDLFFLGDSNARLGPLLGDRNIHGTLITSKNKPHFLGFMDYTGMHLLNKIFAYGQPTYEIAGRKKSIIDLGMASSLEHILNFRVLPGVLGTNIQTCHKIIVLELELTTNTPMCIAAKETGQKRPRFKYTTYESLLKIRSRVLSKLRDIEHIRSLIGQQMYPTYTALLKLYFAAKVKYLGFKEKKQSHTYTTDKVKDLQNQILVATRRFQEEKSDLSLFLLQQLQKSLIEQYRLDETERFHLWLTKLNRLDHARSTREFYSQLNWKHGDSSPGPIKNASGELSGSWSECLTNWRNFYASLYASAEVSTSSHPRVNDPVLDRPFSFEEIILAVATLSEHKAPGADYILSNDLTILLQVDPIDTQFADDNRFILRYILSALNSLWLKEKVPPIFKQSILCPILKKHDSDPTDPENYRPISLLNTMMKLYEALIKKRLVKWLESGNHLSQLQAAYRTGRSTCDHILVIQELFLEYRCNKIGPRGGKRKRPLYFCFLDLRKAFDTVIRSILFSKLFNVGIKGKMHRIISDMYTGNIARIQIQDLLSPKFEINRGVMQGSKLGPVLFNIFINDLLEELHNSSLGATIAGLTISALGFADDIVLIADQPDHLQQLLLICQTWAVTNKMSFNLDKCNVMVFNRKQGNLHFYLAGEELDIVQKYKYLGIVLTSSGPQNTLYKEHFTKIMEKAKRRIQCIKHLGYHKDGLRPETAIKMYKVLVRPLLEYGAQVMTYRRYYLHSSGAPVSVDKLTFFMKDLEHFQTQALKNLLHCPRNASPSIVRLFAGVEPIASRIDMLKLRYYWRATHSPDNIPNIIISFKKKRIFQENVGFTMEIFNLCCKIGHILFWHGIHRGIENPLNSIKRTINAYYLNKDLTVAMSKRCSFTTLYLRGNAEYGKRYTLVKPFTNAGTFRTSSSRTKFIRALLNTNSYLQKCNFCSVTFYNLLNHQLTRCPYLTTQRETLQHKLALYGFSADSFSHLCDISRLIMHTLWDKNLLISLTDFLEEVDY